MDNRKFDDLTRVFASGVSRRSLVKSITAAILGTTAITRGARQVAAVCGNAGDPCDPVDGCCTGTTCVLNECVACIALGEECLLVDGSPCCDQSHECGFGGSGFICRVPCIDDGQACTQGGTACCSAGFSCTSFNLCQECSTTSCQLSSDCCDGLVCSNTQCVEPCSPGGVCSVDTDCCAAGEICLNGTCGTCLDVPSSCADGSDCCSGSCDQSGGTCCHNLGDSCVSDCCGDLTCGPLGTCCLAVAESCSTGSDCCSQACVGNVCCEGLGVSCSEGQCCGTLQCENGACCAPAGNSCGSDAACCDGHFCSAGTCVAEPSCLGTGDTCSVDEDCCSGLCDGSEDVCCLGLDGECSSGIDCCGFFDCDNGSCCATSGLSCTSTDDCCGELNCVSGTCTVCLASDVTPPSCDGGGTIPTCCEENAIYNPNTCQCSVRCTTGGTSCLSDANCDSDEWCSGGCCVPCLADGEGVYCATSQACCSGNCDMNNCGCRSIQTDCTEDSQCCSGICSDLEPHLCLPPASNCTTYVGTSCTQNSHCASDEYCDNLVDCCIPCKGDGEGADCDNDDMCCSGNCVMNNCGCRSIQTECSDDSECCSGLCSVDEPRVCVSPCSVFDEPCEDTFDCCESVGVDVECIAGKCGACFVTDIVPEGCIPGFVFPIECCDPLAEWNSLACKCEIVCELEGATCDYDKDCCGDLQCFDGACGEYPVCSGEKGYCDKNHHCCKGYSCVEGYCRPAKTPDPPVDKGGDTPAYVDTLPSTGSGPDQSSASTIGQILVGGAAAAAAAWVIREKSVPETESEIAES